MNSFQQKIFIECLDKGSGGLLLPMGSGKTLIALNLIFTYFEKYKKPSLIVLSKTLIASWDFEIKKFYPHFVMNKDYIILHPDYNKKINYNIQTPDLRFALITPELLAKYYTLNNILDRFVVNPDPWNTADYTFILMTNTPLKPSNRNIGYDILYSLNWASLFLDEGQKYTNIRTKRTQAIASVSAIHRWVLSGTMFYEPSASRLLGYYRIINDQKFPLCIAETKKLLKSGNFEGTNKTMVIYNENIMIDKNLKHIKHIIHFQMSNEEILLYLSIRDIMLQINKHLKKQIFASTARQFSSYLLVCINYFRQILTSPMTPIASAYIDMAVSQHKSDLSRIIIQEITHLGLLEWIDDEDNAYSSRMKKAVEIVNSKPTDQFVIFNSFKSCLDIFHVFLKRNIDSERKVIIFNMNNTVIQRMDKLLEFGRSPNAILLLTYQMGAEGLNLQSCHNVIIMDSWWNGSVIKQAIARCYRFGQTHNVHSYFLTSDTGIENIMFKKSIEKLELIDAYASGKKVSTHIIPKKMDDIMKMMDNNEDNMKLVAVLNDKTYNVNKFHKINFD